ncbi:hypothetical protein COA17_01495 [Sphingomonas ginsenosidimutans]|jgi:hypothetical protein|uniref:Uncharacterized protein n=2 Tax=Sphingomonas ginsenosidimutans TaxID=862134 RepID=A0A2A4I0L0_9SPHN|nr:hypothetical protein COA17_01495 [Sphingomonas ginsenosidimutans]
MMRWTILPLALLAGAAVPVADEDAAVLRGVLAAVDRGGAGMCVPAELTEAPFAGIRRMIVEAAHDHNHQAPGPAERRTAIRAMTAEWEWVADRPVGPALRRAVTDAAYMLAESGDPTPVEYEAVGELNASDTPEGGATVSPAQPRDFGKVDAGWLALGQRLGTAATCGFPVLTLSAVARRGDIAFVEVGISGGPLSGAGEIWALRRTPDGWRTVARRRTWVS